MLIEMRLPSSSSSWLSAARLRLSRKKPTLGAPASIVQALTFSCLKEADVELDPEKRPQRLATSDWASADLIVNMSGHGVFSVIPEYKGDVLIWEIPDPIGLPIGAYREARDLIDTQIDALATALREGTRLPGL